MKDTPNNNTAQDKWDYLVSLDEELLKGGATISPKATVLIQNVDIAYCSDAPIAAIVLAVAAMECHMRAEYGADSARGFKDVIDASDFNDDVRRDLHALRRERNRWVHARDEDDTDGWLNADMAGAEHLEPLARDAVRLLRLVVYDNPWV